MANNFAKNQLAKICPKVLVLTSCGGCAFVTVPVVAWTRRRDNNAELGSALRMWSIAGARRLLGSYLLTDVKDAIHYRVLSL